MSFLEIVPTSIGAHEGPPALPDDSDGSASPPFSDGSASPPLTPPKSPWRKKVPARLTFDEDEDCKLRTASATVPNSQAAATTFENPLLKPQLPMVSKLLVDSGKFSVRKPNVVNRGPTALHHIKTISLISLTFLAMLLCIVWLKEVLVPLLLAGFFMCQLEPLLFGLLNPASMLAPCSSRMAARAKRVNTERVEVFSQKVARKNQGKTQERHSSKHSKWWKLHAALALIACVLFVLFIISVCVYLIWRSVEGFSWRKYADSPRFKTLVREITRIKRKVTGKVKELKNVDEVDYSAFVEWLMQGPILQGFLKVTLNIFGIAFLTVLFLAFLLISDLSSNPNEDTGLKKTARLSVQRYVRIKTQVSLTVALLVWLVLEAFEVDLAFLFAMITFVLNYIPHIGYTIAVLLPIPLVYLDPTKTLSDVLWCLLLPVFIHAVFSHFVEPRILAKYLDLHPVVVLASLAFWTVCWGAVGAIVSVPLTSIVRLVLLEIDHPYALVVVGMLEGQWGPSTIRKDALGPTKERLSSITMETWMVATSPHDSPQRLGLNGSPSKTENSSERPTSECPSSPTLAIRTSVPDYFASLHIGSRQSDMSPTSPSKLRERHVHSPSYSEVD